MSRRVGSLFSGIEGIGMGLRIAHPEWRIAWVCESDPFCREVLAARVPEATQFEDVRELSSERCEPVEVLAGGFPCQDLSPAGLGAGMGGERSGLWSEFGRLIGELRPELVVIENVPMLLTRGASKGLGYGGGMERVLADLHGHGYGCEWDCVPAAEVGAPHLRDRVWIVAHRDDVPAPGALGGEAGGAVAYMDDADGRWHGPQSSLLDVELVTRWPRAGCMGGGVVREAEPLAPMARFRAGAGWPTPRVSAERSSRDAMVREGHWAAPSLAQMAELAAGELPREFESVDELSPAAREVYDAAKRGETPALGYASFPTPTRMDATLRAVGRPDSYGRHAVQLAHLANSGALEAGDGEEMWAAHDEVLRETFEGRAVTYGPDGEKRESDRWATPRATDADRGGRGDLLAQVRGRPNGHSGRRFPTPTAQDGSNNGGPSQFERNTPPLNAHVAVWPTDEHVAAGERLRALMSELSEGCYAATWLQGLEFDLWSLMLLGGGEYGDGEVTADQADELRALSAEAQAWWAWSDERESEVPVPLHAWLEAVTVEIEVEDDEAGALWQTPTADPWDKGGGGGELQAQVNAAGDGPPTPGKHPAQRRYPTPTAADGDRASETYPRGNATLRGAAQAAEDEEGGAPEGMWPTPQASDGSGGRNEAGALERAREDGRTGRTLERPSGSKASVSLRTAVDAAERGLWPTPTSAPGGPDFARGEREGSGGDSLETAVVRSELWPTPTVKGNYNRSELADKAGDGLATAVVRRSERSETTALNPDWVEWLMGYPRGYTDPEVSGEELGEHPGFAVEPAGLPRVAAGVPRRAKRLAALGNSVLPQVVAAWARRLPA